MVAAGVLDAATVHVKFGGYNSTRTSLRDPNGVKGAHKRICTSGMQWAFTDLMWLNEYKTHLT